MVLQQPLYLRKPLPEKRRPAGSSQYQGWTLMRYKDIYSGSDRVLSNRINNYYPKELRIRGSLKYINLKT
ncbi:methyltransferase RsmF C-terminal domain-like protein [Chitinophaga sp. YR573]|uniref:methyltransferase RsmF C-terminal domain-like protein n=1 Tax=Chitinophaga sp. YR573 TaxID=1881040 RepID=UPI00115FB7D3